MSKLIDIIRRNQALMDDIEPMPGHLERFKNKLEKANGIRSVLIPLFAAASIATMVTIFLFSVKINYGSEISLGDISTEYKEAEIYYQNAFNSEHNKFQKYAAQDATLINYVEMELEQMEESYKQLVIDFRTNPFDSRMISAIIIHFQTKVDFLKDINERLENNNVKTGNDFNYEGNRI